MGLCQRAATGDLDARRLARELEDALTELSQFDEGPDLVLFYKYLLVLLGDADYERHFNEADRLSPSQQHFAEAQLKLFQQWWAQWPGKSYGI